MKRTMTALLLALALVLSLSGCTSKKDNGSNSGTSQNSMTDNGSGSNNGSSNNGGSNNGGSNGSGNNANSGNTNNGTMNGGTNSSDNGTANPGNGSRSYNGYGTYAQPGSNGATSSDSVDEFMAGRSYEDMLRNGRVHDRDGILTDGENSVSER